MPDQRFVLKAVGKSVGVLLVATLLVGSGALFGSGCTDNSGNGTFVEPGTDAAAGGTNGGAGAGGTNGSTGGTGGAATGGVGGLATGGVGGLGIGGVGGIGIGGVGGI